MDSGTVQGLYYSMPPEAWYPSLESLRDATLAMRTDSASAVGYCNALTATHEDGRLYLSHRRQESRRWEPNAWAFRQLATRVQAPGGYLASLPAPLAAECLNHGLRESSARTMLLYSQGTGEMRAATGPTYGRVWNHELVDLALAIRDRTGGSFDLPPVWPSGPGAVRPDGSKVGGAWLNQSQCAIFLIDGGSIVGVPSSARGQDDELYRGVFLRQSEVGDAAWELTLLRFRACCGNLAIMGMETVLDCRIIHTAHAARRVREALESIHAQVAALPDDRLEVEATIRKARAFALPTKEPELLEWKPLAPWSIPARKAIIEMAVREEGQCATLWDVVQGGTARARDLPTRQETLAESRKVSQLFRVLN